MPTLTPAGVITGKQLRDQRVRRGMSREDLADAVGVSLKSIGNWERSHVPANKEALVWDVLFAAADPLATLSDLELLAELGRRIGSRQRSGNETPTNPTLPGLRSKPTRGTAGRIRPRTTSKGAINAHQDASDV